MKAKKPKEAKEEGALHEKLLKKRDSAIKFRDDSGWVDRRDRAWNYYLFGQAEDLNDATLRDKKNKRKANYVFSNIESIIPKMFDRMPGFQVMPRGVDDELKAPVVESVLRYEVENLDLEDKFKDAVRDQLVSALGVLKVCWKYSEKESAEKEKKGDDEKKEDEPMVEDDEPEVRVINPENFWITAGDSRLEECCGVFEKMYVPAEEAKKKYKKDFEASYSLSKIKDTEKAKYGDEMGRCVVWEFHGTIDGVKKVVCFNETEVLSTRDWYEHGRLPYVVFPCYQKPHEFYPYSEVFQIEPLQDELLEIDNQASEFRKRAINPKRIVKKGSLDSVNMERLRNPKINVVEINEVGSIAWENPPLIGQDIYNMRAAKKEDIGLMTGQNEISRGGTEKVVKTATGQQILFDAAQGRIRDKVRVMERAYKEILIQLQGLLAQFMDDDRVVKITDEHGDIYEAYSKEDIKGSFDFIIDTVESTPILREKRGQLALQAYREFRDDKSIDQIALKKTVIKLAFPDLSADELVIENAEMPQPPLVKEPAMPEMPMGQTMMGQQMMPQGL